MDIASIFTILTVAASSLFAARHIDAWERDKWIQSILYTVVSVAALFIIGLINKRLYLFIVIFYVFLFFNLQYFIKSKAGHIWFSLFVGISGMFPIAVYQLYFS